MKFRRIGKIWGKWGNLTALRFRNSINYEKFNGINIYAKLHVKTMYVDIMLMMIMINMIGWLIGYVIYFGTSMFQQLYCRIFRQKYMNIIIIYMSCTWNSCKQEWLKVKYEAYAECMHNYVQEWEKDNKNL